MYMKSLLMIPFVVHFQPPWDLEIGKKFIVHYTYGCDYNLKVKYVPFSILSDFKNWIL